MSLLCLLFQLGVFIKALLLLALSNAGVPWGCFCGMASCFFISTVSLKHAGPCSPTYTHIHTPMYPRTPKYSALLFLSEHLNTFYAPCLDFNYNSVFLCHLNDVSGGK